jgi:hypothetical protein
LQNMKNWKLKSKIYWIYLYLNWCFEYICTYMCVCLREGGIAQVGFEVLTAVVMKSTAFWDITQCSLLKVNRRFGGTYCLHLQGRKLSWARKQHDSRWLLPSLLSLFFDPEDGGDMFLRNVGW